MSRCPTCGTFGHLSETSDEWEPLGKQVDRWDCPQMDKAFASMIKKDSTKPTRLAWMIRIWAAAADIQQADLAKQWGATPSTVTRFLSGESMPDGRTLAKIIAWLLEDSQSSGDING